jgi:hypothetical protein
VVVPARPHYVSLKIFLYRGNSALCESVVYRYSIQSVTSTPQWTRQPEVITSISLCTEETFLGLFFAFSILCTNGIKPPLNSPQVHLARGDPAYRFLDCCLRIWVRERQRE